MLARGNAAQRPRELRRRVVLPARLRLGASWADACILNISSRGLLIHSSRSAPHGSVVELRRGDHVILARVVWRDGAKAGLQADERLPVEEIVSLAQSAGLQLTAGPHCAERRKQARALDEDSRVRARTYQFVAAAAVSVSLVGCAFAMVEQAFARPLLLIRAALGG